MHCLVFFVLFLLKRDLILQELPLVIPLSLEFLIFIDHLLVYCAHFFILSLNNLLLIVFFHGFQLLLLLLIFELDLDIRLTDFTLALLYALAQISILLVQFIHPRC